MDDNGVRKRQRNSQQQQLDRISELPDFILGEILSFLPTDDAVATSILSKRWKSTWLLLRNLDFFYNTHNDMELYEDNVKFIDFVYRMLFLHHLPMLTKFRLVWISYLPVFIHFVSSWVNAAISRNIRELSLDFHCDAMFDVPTSVFTCVSLECFETIGWSRISFPASFVVCLPRLTKLILRGVDPISEEDFEKLIIGCPLLYHLELPEHGADITFIISSTSLRRLFLHCVYHYCLKLEAPSLEYLKLDGTDVPIDFVYTSVGSRVEVDFAISPYDHQSSHDDSIVEAVGVFDSAKSLILSAETIKALSRGTVKLCTKFNNLVKLEAYVQCYDWGSLQDLIQLSDNLQLLTIHQGDLDSEDIDLRECFKWTTLAEVPRCLSKSLKEVVFDGYYGNVEDEHEVIRYMLTHGSVLEVMKIICVGEMNSSSKLKAVQEIREYPRKSPFCVIKVL